MTETKFEREYRECGEEAADMATKLPSAERWPFVVALFWIALRRHDHEALRAERFWARSFARDAQAGFLNSMVESWLSGPRTPVKDSQEEQPLFHNKDPVEGVVDPRPAASLLTALRAGSVVASGVTGRSGARQDIPSAEWEDLTFADRDGLPLTACAVALDAANARHWANLRLDRASVLRAFPRPTVAVVKANAVTEAASVLTEVMRKSPLARTHTNADLEALCGLTGRPFADAKRRAIIATDATAWVKAGRPKNAAPKSPRQ